MPSPPSQLRSRPNSSETAIKFYLPVNTGRFWNPIKFPAPPNTSRAQVLRLQPQADCFKAIGGIYGFWWTTSLVMSLDWGERCRWWCRWIEGNDGAGDVVGLRGTMSLDWGEQCRWIEGNDVVVCSGRRRCTNKDTRLGAFPPAYASAP
jgi:hypothetical protein